MSGYFLNKSITSVTERIIVIAQEIINLRRRLGMSQVMLAKRIGVSFATVNRWENHRHSPSKLALEKIKLLDITHKYLN